VDGLILRDMAMAMALSNVRVHDAPCRRL